MILQNPRLDPGSHKVMYEVVSTAEYKSNPSNLMDKKASIHCRSPKNGHPPTTILSTASRNSLSNKTAAYFM
jgi:hypothetical protein